MRFDSGKVKAAASHCGEMTAFLSPAFAIRCKFIFLFASVLRPVKNLLRGVFHCLCLKAVFFQSWCEAFDGTVFVLISLDEKRGPVLFVANHYQLFVELRKFSFI